MMLSSHAVSAVPNCETSGPDTLCYLTHVSDFSGQNFEHLSFDPADEHTTASIGQKFQNIATFNIVGGNGSIRHMNDYSRNFPGEGEGGAKGDKGEKGEQGDPGKDAAFANLQCATRLCKRKDQRSDGVIARVISITAGADTR